MADMRPEPASAPEALEQAIARFAPSVRKFVARRLRASADVDDVTQEVLTRMLRRAQNGPVENVEGYIFQVAANLLAERGRINSRRGAAHAVELDPRLLGEGEEPSPERILQSKQAFEALLEALQELPERTRTMFILNRFEDMSGVEIAKALGVSVSAVEKGIMRAIAHLKSRMP